MKIFTALVLRTRAVKIFITALVPRSVKFITRPPPVAVIPHYNPSAEVSKSHDMPDSEAGKVIISNITEIWVHYMCFNLSCNFHDKIFDLARNDINFLKPEFKLYYI